MLNPISSIFLLPLVEKAATAIAAGVICGTFLGAMSGAVRGWSRRTVEGDALRNGYHGAVGTLGIALYDLCNLYAASL